MGGAARPEPGASRAAPARARSVRGAPAGERVWGGQPGTFSALFGAGARVGVGHQARDSPCRLLFPGKGRSLAPCLCPAPIRVSLPCQLLPSEEVSAELSRDVPAPASGDLLLGQRLDRFALAGAPAPSRAEPCRAQPSPAQPSSAQPVGAQRQGRAALPAGAVRVLQPQVMVGRNRPLGTAHRALQLRVRLRSGGGARARRPPAHGRGRWAHGEGRCQGAGGWGATRGSLCLRQPLPW